MPIYAYRCDACGHRKDVLQKMSDPALTVCPSCGAESFAKQLSAPAFQLKGTGWYVTDFRDNAKKADGAEGKTVPAAEGGTGNAEGKDAGASKDTAERKPDGKSDGAAPAKSDGASAGGSGTTAPAVPVKPAGKSDGASGSTRTAGGGSSAA